MLAKLRMNCSQCKEPCQASGFKLLSPESWAGGFQGVCLQCSGEDQRTFFTAVRKLWRRRAAQLGKQLTRAREMTWKRLEEELQREYPGEAKHDLRVLVRARLRAVAARWAADLAANEDQKKLASALHQQYCEQLTLLSRDPARTVTPSGISLKAEDAQYLSHFSKSILILWLCRRCCHFTDNSQWLKKVRSHHFRCPMCHELYQPWVEATAAAQKVLCLGWPGPNGDTQWQIIPCRWPDSEEDSWLAKQMQGYRRLERGESVDSILAKTKVELADLLQPFTCTNIGPSRCKKIPFREPTKIWPQDWDWKHLTGQVLSVGRLTESELNMPAFNDWKLLCPLLGRMASCGDFLLGQV